MPLFLLPTCEFQITLSIFFLASWTPPILSLLIPSSSFYSFLFILSSWWLPWLHYKVGEKKKIGEIKGIRLRRMWLFPFNRKLLLTLVFSHVLWDGVPIFYILYSFNLRIVFRLQSCWINFTFVDLSNSLNILMSHNLDTLCLTIISSDLKYINIFTWICIIFSFQAKLLLFIHFYFNYLIANSTNFSSFRVLNIHFQSLKQTSSIFYM